MQEVNPWDKVADQFNTYKQNVWYGAADNVASAWPSILDYIKKRFADPQGLKALDFGCGTGMFCAELKRLGFEATGIDQSEEMIKIGKKYLDPNIKLSVGNTRTAQALSEKEDKFDLITSIMVLQFIPDEELASLIYSLKDSGIIVFANHNPKRLSEKGMKDILYLTDTNIPVTIYQRNVEDYDKIFLKYGFVRDMEYYATQDQKFVTRYKISLTKNPKYLILGYKR